MLEPARASARLEVAGRRVVVVGLAASGLAAAEALAAGGAEVLVTEARGRDAVADNAARAEAVGATVAAGGHRPDHLEGAHLVVTSPGVPEGAEVLQWAAAQGAPVWSEIELGARLATAPYIGVTGTNGKTTATELVAAAMRVDGLDAVACGNVGHPFSRAAGEGHDALAVEASSFQLRFHQTFHPKVSVLLNLAEDHLDWHGSFRSYARAKARILVRQGPEDVHVGNRDDPAAADVSAGAPCRVVWFTSAEPAEGEVGYAEGELVSRLDGEARLGRPASPTPAFLADAAAAAAAALAFGVAPEAVAAAVGDFRPLPHRGSVVAEVDGVRFVDDSKATNPHAALRSIAAWERPVLVAGGLSKGVDLAPLAGASSRLRGVVAIGSAADDLVDLFEGRASVVRADSIEEAARAGLAMAEPGGVVLLAPACASQDMFRDYRERGERFAAAARALGMRGGRG